MAAATRGAMAVVDGNVMAINPGEEPKMQMFIWNNIFFSLGFDVRDHYKDLGGDAAAFVAPVRLIIITLKLFRQDFSIFYLTFVLWAKKINNTLANRQTFFFCFSSIE